MNYPLFLRTELLIKYVRLMDKILNLDSVDLYNKLYGLETLNPLVSVIDLNKATSSVDHKPPDGPLKQSSITASTHCI